MPTQPSPPPPARGWLLPLLLTFSALALALVLAYFALVWLTHPPDNTPWQYLPRETRGVLAIHSPAGLASTLLATDWRQPLAEAARFSAEKNATPEPILGWLADYLPYLGFLAYIPPSLVDSLLPSPLLVGQADSEGIRAFFLMARLPHALAWGLALTPLGETGELAIPVHDGEAKFTYTIQQGWWLMASEKALLEQLKISLANPQPFPAADPPASFPREQGARLVLLITPEKPPPTPLAPDGNPFLDGFSSFELPPPSPPDSGAVFFGEDSGYSWRFLLEPVPGAWRLRARFTAPHPEPVEFPPLEPPPAALDSTRVGIELNLALPASASPGTWLETILPPPDPQAELVYRLTWEWLKQGWLDHARRSFRLRLGEPGPPDSRYPDLPVLPPLTLAWRLSGQPEAGDAFRQSWGRLRDYLLAPGGEPLFQSLRSRVLPREIQLDGLAGEGLEVPPLLGYHTSPGWLLSTPVPGEEGYGIMSSQIFGVTREEGLELGRNNLGEGAENAFQLSGWWNLGPAARRELAALSDDLVPFGKDRLADNPRQAESLVELETAFHSWLRAFPRGGLAFSIDPEAGAGEFILEWRK